MDFIDAERVHELLDYPGLIEALAVAHREEAPLVDRSLLQAPDGTLHAGESFLVLPAWAPGRAMGVKMATVVPRNAERDDALPTIHAAYQLFDGERGVPTAVIDGTALTLRKTAADSGLGCRLLARPDVECLLMVGAGAMAPHLVAAHRAARPSLARVMVWNRGTERRDALVEGLRAEGIDAEPVESLAAAVPTADVISCATASMEPLVLGEWLCPGQHLDLVGSFSPSMRETDDACVRRARLFVDSRASTVEAAGDLFRPLTDGVISAEDIRGDLFELCAGRTAGRERDEEITLYKNGGGGHLDLFTAEHLYRRHREADTGGGTRR
jgi:ornithine cyclodeaminase